MTAETTLVFNISASAFISGIFLLFAAMLGLVWRAREEMARMIREEIRKELGPLEDRVSRVENIIEKLVYAVIEIQTILREKFSGLTIAHGLHDARDERLQ